MQVIRKKQKKRKYLLRAAVLLPVALLAVLWREVPDRRTYIITDGSRVLVHTTAEPDHRAVLEEAGVRLEPDDAWTVRDEGGTVQIRIRRRQRIVINYHGRLLEEQSSGETVAQLLERLELPWCGDDILSPSPETQTYDGMKLTVTRLIRQEQTYSSVLHHETHRYTDTSLPEGTEKVLIPGVDGEMVCTASVTYVNGAESERTVLSRQVTRQPVDAVIAVGAARAGKRQNTGMLLPVITDDTIILPTGEVLTYDRVITSLATAYCDKGLTATGTQARVGAIAVDPRVIPYGTRMFIMSVDGEYIYGIATAEDCGSREHIYGTRTDLHFDTYAECRQFGARDCLVFFLS